MCALVIKRILRKKVDIKYLEFTRGIGGALFFYCFVNFLLQPSSPLPYLYYSVSFVTTGNLLCDDNCIILKDTICAIYLF